MQANTLTLSVDLANNSSATDQVFTRFEEGVNRSLYTGPDHTLITRNTLTLLRTPPKRTGVYYGNAKTGAKFTKDITVTQADGTETVAPIIMELSASIPVGASAADVLAVRQHMVTILDRDDIAGSLQTQLSI